MVNARFWVWHGDGVVKLTLRPGQTLETYKGGNTDEGYSCESCRWSFDGEFVTREWASWGRDCDGRHEAGGEDHCHLSQLHAVEPSWEGLEGIMYPAWTKVDDTWQRDYTAEAAGY